MDLTRENEDGIAGLWRNEPGGSHGRKRGGGGGPSQYG